MPLPRSAGVGKGWPVASALAYSAGEAPVAVGDLAHRYFTVGSGTESFSIANGFEGVGLSYSIRSFPVGAVLTINAATGAMTAQTAAAASGDVVVRATNGAGYAEQTFPLFVVVPAQYTVLARQTGGKVDVESLAPVWMPTLTREVNGNVTVGEAL